MSIAIGEAIDEGIPRAMPQRMLLRYIFPSIFISGTLLGAATKSDGSAEVPPQRVNLSISPTPTRGLRAALSFNF